MGRGRSATYDDQREMILERAAGLFARGGYPGTYPKGLPIHGVSEADALDDVTVFHAGTKLDGGVLVTSGGRVLAVTGTGATLRGALDRAYAGVAKVGFEGMHARRDIGHRALKGS